MTYLPNSIERCTPIVGFDPYAFIMDRPSNLRINKMQSPYDMDYFAPGPEKCKDETAQNPDGTKKKGILGTALKLTLGIAAIGLAIAGIRRGVGAITSGGGATGGGIGACLRNAGRCAMQTFTNGISFAGRQLTRFANFIQSKIPTTPPPTP